MKSQQNPAGPWEARHPELPGDLCILRCSRLICCAWGPRWRARTIWGPLGVFLWNNSKTNWGLSVSIKESLFLPRAWKAWAVSSATCSSAVITCHVPALSTKEGHYIPSVSSAGPPRLYHCEDSSPDHWATVVTITTTTISLTGTPSPLAQPLTDQAWGSASGLSYPWHVGPIQGRCLFLACSPTSPQQNPISASHLGMQWLRRMCVLSHVWLFATPWTVAQQAPLSMGFSRQQSWSRLPFPPPGELPDIGIEVMSPESPALGGRFSTTAPPGKPIYVKPQWIRWFHTAAKSWNQRGLESFTAVGQNAGDVVLVRLGRFLCKWRQLFYLRWWESLLGVSVWREEQPGIPSAAEWCPVTPQGSSENCCIWDKVCQIYWPTPSWSRLTMKAVFWMAGWLNHYRKMCLNSQAQ